MKDLDVGQIYNKILEQGKYNPLQVLNAIYTMDIVEDTPMLHDIKICEADKKQFMFQLREQLIRGAINYV